MNDHVLARASEASVGLESLPSPVFIAGPAVRDWAFRRAPKHIDVYASVKEPTVIGNKHIRPLTTYRDAMRSYIYTLDRGGISVINGKKPQFHDEGMSAAVRRKTLALPGKYRPQDTVLTLKDVAEAFYLWKSYKLAVATNVRCLVREQVERGYGWASLSAFGEKNKKHSIKDWSEFVRICSFND